MQPRRLRARDRMRDRQTSIMTGWMVRVLTGGFWLSLALISLGILAALLRWEPLGTEAAALPDVVSEALRGDQQAIVDLGILVLLLTPGATVVAALVSAIAQRDRFLLSVCLILLGIIALSVVIGL
jgi:uncharacterized membrane protein